MPRPSPSPRRRHGRTTRSSSTAASASARPICCTRSGISLTATIPNSRYLYVSVETFTNEFINALRDGNIRTFKDRYRSVDVLLIDDIQSLQGREQTQEEFFHTFNALHDSGKQIVICSDRPPKAIATLEDRLALAIRDGPDHRHPAAGPRDPHRHPAQAGPVRRATRSTTPRCSRSSPRACPPTSARSRVR